MKAIERDRKIETDRRAEGDKKEADRRGSRSPMRGKKGEKVVLGRTHL